MCNKFKNLISNNRLLERENKEEDVNLAIGSDRGRIIFSAPFRRLQKKAQVFPLETNGAIRSRLTHSLEVAHLGMYIAEKILSTKDLKLTFLHKNSFAFTTLVENACLMHDLGNPPFGHFGEKAIKDWFNKNETEFKEMLGAEKKDEKKVCEFFENEYLDFTEFDGNPQGLRIVTKLQGNDGKSGLNLTFSQLASYLKYVKPPNEFDKKQPFQKKPGYFLSEKDLVEKMWENLCMKKSQRYPLVYIMEAADDLAYCMSDIEDGIEKNIINWKQFEDGMTRIWEKKTKNGKVDLLKDLFGYANDETRKTRITELISFKTKLNNDLVAFSAKRFVDNIKEILDGKASSIFNEGSDERLILDALKEFTRKNLFRSLEAENIELAGYAVISGILDHLKPLLICSKEDFNAIKEYKTDAPGIGKTDLHRRLFHRLPDSYVFSYEAAICSEADKFKEWFYRAHLIVDYVSGMTDQYALETYQLLSGITVG